MLFASPSTAADKPAPTNRETVKIEALLEHLESLKEASFIRNDTALPEEVGGDERGDQDGHGLHR